MVVDYIALKEERQRRGLGLREFAKTAGLSVNAVRTVEGEMTKSDGTLRLPRTKTVKDYCASLSKLGRPVTREDFLVRGLVLRAPEFVDFRPFDAWSDDPTDTRWRSSGLRIGIGTLDLTTQVEPSVTVQDVRLGTDLYATIANKAKPDQVLAPESDFQSVSYLEAFCQWTAGSTHRFGASAREQLGDWTLDPDRKSEDLDYAHLGLVRYQNLQANRPFVPTAPIFSHEVMFSSCPNFVTFENFVKTWSRVRTNVEFTLTVRYRTGQLTDTASVKFTLPGEVLSLYCRSALHWARRGYPAFLQVCREGIEDLRPFPNDPETHPDGPWFGRAEEN